MDFKFCVLVVCRQEEDEETLTGPSTLVYCVPSLYATLEIALLSSSVPNVTRQLK